MKEIIERNIATIIVAIVILIACSSCASTNYNSNPAYAGWNTGCGR